MMANRKHSYKGNTHDTCIQNFETFKFKGRIRIEFPYQAAVQKKFDAKVFLWGVSAGGRVGWLLQVGWTD